MQRIAKTRFVSSSRSDVSLKKLRKFLSDEDNELNNIKKLIEFKVNKERVKRKDFLLRTVPVLKKVKNVLNDEMFDELIECFIDELEKSFMNGYRSSPKPSAEYGSVRRDT